MFKKLIIIALVVGVGGVMFMPEITATMARTALKTENQRKGWAPGMAYRAANINLKFFRFQTSAAIFERAIEAWPEADWVPDAHYKRALAYEKMEKSEEAIKLYEGFLAKYPTHHWNEQAQKRISNIKVNLL